ncbi:MAG: putative GNAT family N-acyltransferase [Bacteriovoracaceae bacterium]|jgi:predicted GNAT family N-acyltransferase
MKYVNLREKPNYFEDLMKLIESGFSYEEQYSYKEDFFLLIEESNWENLHLLISDKDEIVAHVGTRLLKLNNDTPVLFIGGIVVNPTYKGRGHFKELFSKVINIYKDRVAFMVLWSDLDGLYKKFNFHEAGEIVQTGANNISEENLNKIGYKHSDLSKFIDSGELESCYKQPLSKETLLIKRDKEHWKKIAHIKSSRFFTYLKDNKLVSYLFLGKGMDMPSVIHEIGFSNLIDQEKILPELYPYKLWLPFIEEVIPSNEETSFFLGIFRISDNSLFKKFVSSISNNEIEVLKIDEGEITFTQNEVENKLLHQEFLNLILLPSDSINPIPFWITGIESI